MPTDDVKWDTSVGPDIEPSWPLPILRSCDAIESEGVVGE